MIFLAIFRSGFLFKIFDEQKNLLFLFQKKNRRKHNLHDRLLVTKCMRLTACAWLLYRLMRAALWMRCDCECGRCRWRVKRTHMYRPGRQTSAHIRHTMYHIHVCKWPREPVRSMYACIGSVHRWIIQLLGRDELVLRQLFGMAGPGQNAVHFRMPVFPWHTRQAIHCVDDDISRLKSSEKSIRKFFVGWETVTNRARFPSQTHTYTHMLARGCVVV